jgi:hypothetical protein
MDSIELQELKEELKTRITEGYFIYCKPTKRPDFKTYDEAHNWYEKNNWIAEKIVGSWVDRVIAVLEMKNLKRKEDKR